jgi:hypothetical protein
MEEERLFIKLSNLEPGSQPYKDVMFELVKLYNLKRINNDMIQKILPTVLGVTANIGGLLLVMNYERLNIFVTKAFGLVYKPKVL